MQHLKPPSTKFCPKCGMLLDEKEGFNIKDTNSQEFQKFILEAFKRWKANKVYDRRRNC